VNPVPLEAMSSLDFQFPFSLEFVETNRLNWLTGISVRLGSSIASLGHFFRFKRSIGFDRQHPTVPNTRGKTDLGLRMGSHCAYVGPDRGIGLVTVGSVVINVSYEKGVKQIASYTKCLNLCQRNDDCSYWQYSGNTCTLMAIDYPTKSGETSGYCTEGKLSQCSTNTGHPSFTSYKQLKTPNSGDCMEACFQDVTKCINWNWNSRAHRELKESGIEATKGEDAFYKEKGVTTPLFSSFLYGRAGVCKLYHMATIRDTYVAVHSGSCA